MEVKATTTDNTEPLEPGGLTAKPARQHSRKRNITVFVIVCLLNVGLLAILWTQLTTPATVVPKGASHSVDDPSLTGFISSPLIGRPAPDFKLSALNGSVNSAKQVHLADFKGRPVIINFWSSSCAPCQVETPFLQKSWSGLQQKGVSLIGIDGFEQVSNAQSFMQRYGVTYTNVQDNLDGATGISFGVTGNPETYFIDKNGVVVARWIGALNEQGLQSGLAKMHLN